MSDESELPQTRLSQVTPLSGSTELEGLPLQTPGRYTAVDGAPELGHGGMGRVLRLFDTHLRREVAIKELLPEHANQQSSLGPLLGSLFIREARVMARLEHPGIVPVYELARRVDGAPYYAMRHIEGRSLASALERCSTLSDRLTLLPHYIDVVQAIAYAHSRGITHRDLKPANVMVGPFGETQVLDWGLAQVAGEPDLASGSGTPAYMSPEHSRSKVTDARSDVWALGVMLFELLAGQLPFTADSQEVLARAVDGPTPSMQDLERRAPPALVAVMNRALQRAPEQRFANASEMARALEEAQRFVAPSAVRFVVTAAVLVVATLTLAGLLARWSAARDARDYAMSRALSEERRTSSRRLGDAAGLALRANETQRAATLADEALHEADADAPLARGVGLVARERGVPRQAWSVGVEAGCSAVAVMGEVVACATLGGVALFNADTGATVPMLKTGPQGWQRAVTVLSHDRLASAGDDRVVHVWSVSLGKEVQHFADFESTILALASSGASVFAGLRDGRVVEISSDGRKINRWSMPGPVEAVSAASGVLAAAGGSLVRVQLENGVPIEVKGRCGALLAEPGLVTVALERSVLELSGNGVQRVFTTHRDSVTALARGDRLISSDAAGEVQWGFAQLPFEGTLTLPQGRVVAAATAGLRVFVAPQGPALVAIDLPARRETLREEATPTFHAYWSRGWLVSGLSDGRIRKYELASREVSTFESRHRSGVRAVAEVKGEERPETLRHLSAGDDGQVLAQRWNGEVTVLDSNSTQAISALAVDPAGTRAAWSFNDGALVLWSLSFGKEISRERVGLVHTLVFSPDGRWLAAGREDERVALYAAESGKAGATLGPSDGPVLVLRWSGDGERLFSAGAETKVTEWSVANGSALRTFSTARGQVTALDVSPDQSRLAAGSEGEVFIWDTETAALWARLPADGGRWSAVHFIDDSTLFAIGSDRVPRRYPLAP